MVKRSQWEAIFHYLCLDSRIVALFKWNDSNPFYKCFFCMQAWIESTFTGIYVTFFLFLKNSKVIWSDDCSCEWDQYHRQWYLEGLPVVTRGVWVENPAPVSDRLHQTQSLARTAAQWPAVYWQRDPHSCSSGWSASWTACRSSDGFHFVPEKTENKKYLKINK